MIGTVQMPWRAGVSGLVAPVPPMPVLALFTPKVTDGAGLSSDCRTRHVRELLDLAIVGSGNLL